MGLPEMPTEIGQKNKAIDDQTLRGLMSMEAVDPPDNPDLPDPEEEGGEEFVKTEPIVAIQMDEPFDVETLEGPVTGDAGDWLAKNPSTGEMWPLDDEVKDATYKKKEVALGFKVGRFVTHTKCCGTCFDPNGWIIEDAGLSETGRQLWKVEFADDCIEIVPQDELQVREAPLATSESTMREGFEDEHGIENDDPIERDSEVDQELMPDPVADMSGFEVDMDEIDSSELENGDRVQTPEGTGSVTDVVEGWIEVELDDGNKRVFPVPADGISKIPQGQMATSREHEPGFEDLDRVVQQEVEDAMSDYFSAGQLVMTPDGEAEVVKMIKSTEPGRAGTLGGFDVQVKLQGLPEGEQGLRRYSITQVKAI
jgi:hypothetical protein